MSLPQSRPPRKRRGKNAPKDVRDQLIGLGAEQLADVLMELAQTSDDVRRFVERTTSGEDGNVRRFKADIAALRRRRKFITYAESSTHARRLQVILQDLGTGVTDPEAGLNLVAEFLRSDSAILEAVDDSNGSIGDVFRVDVVALFVRYGSEVADKLWLADLLYEVVMRDDYGVRYPILEVASKYLPSDALRYLADKFLQAARQERARETADQPRRSFQRPGNWEFRLAEEVARQLNDPEMVESARRESDPDLGIASCLDIGRAWFAAGHPEVALSWVDRSEADHSFMAAERDDLLRDIHTALGNRDVVEQLTWKRFREHRSPESLQPVLALIGEHKRDQVIAAEADAILADDSFDPVDAIFLIESGLVDEAARYVLTRPHLLDAHSYGLLRPMAKAFRRVGYHLAASAVLRTLLDDILARGYSPAYGHAARYLHELDALWEHVSTWDDLLPHPAYVDELRKRHGRKSGFWSRYQEAGDASGDRRKGSRR